MSLTPPLTVMRSMVIGGSGFALVSTAAFSIWAFVGRFLQSQLGEAGLYAVIALDFLVMSGVVLHPLIHGDKRMIRFQGVFLPAFLIYALMWSAAWFTLGLGRGEWLGSLLGCAGFAGMTTWRLGRLTTFWKSLLVLFVLHSAGYFTGSEWMAWAIQDQRPSLLSGWSSEQVGTLAKLGWGLFYGLGFGSGIGATFALAQRSLPANDQPGERRSA